jgi:PAS domain S-box-containing protein
VNPVASKGGSGRRFIDAFSLLDAVDIVVVATDANLVVTYCNRAATQLLGWTVDNAIGCQLANLLTTADSELSAVSLAVFTKAETWSGLIPVRCGDGTTLVLRVTCNAARDREGNIVGAVFSGVGTQAKGDATHSRLPPLHVLSARKVTASTMPLSVLLAADSLLIGQGLAALFAGIPGIAAVGLARDHSQLIRQCAELAPDAIIISIRSSSVASEAMIGAARQLRADFPDLGVVLVSDCGNGFALDLLRDGASRIAYLLDDALPTIDTVIDAVREVTAGQSVLDPSIVDYLVSHRRDVGVDDLTNREADVLELMADGCSNKAIADRLNVSVKSIEKCVTSIFRNLEVADPSRVDRRVAATLSYQRARTTGLETEIRRIRRRRDPAHEGPVAVIPRSDDLSKM